MNQLLISILISLIPMIAWAQSGVSDIQRCSIEKKVHDNCWSVIEYPNGQRYVGVIASEKPQGEGAMINGGFFVLSPQVIDYISDDKTIWEREPMERLAEEGQLAAFHHQGFWQPMDTLRDKQHLEELWQSREAPWKVWK